MNKKEVVLDRTGLFKLAGGMVLLLVFGFTGGAVVGYGLGGAQGPTPTAPAASGVAQKASAAQPCTPTDVDKTLRTADASAFEPPASSTPASRGARPSADAPATVVASVAGASRAEAHDASAPARAATETEPASAPETPETPRAHTKYAVQLGVFGVAGNAERLASRMRARGYDPIITAMRNRSGQWLKRVNLSVYTSEDEATAAAGRFRAREGLPAVVVALQEEQK